MCSVIITRRASFASLIESGCDFSHSGSRVNESAPRSPTVHIKRNRYHAP
jgi:hypothetical protein